MWSYLRIYICLVFPSVDVHSLPLSLHVCISESDGAKGQGVELLSGEDNEQMVEEEQPEGEKTTEEGTPADMVSLWHFIFVLKMFPFSSHSHSPISDCLYCCLYIYIFFHIGNKVRIVK